jgi:hypothetical protein
MPEDDTSLTPPAVIERVQRREFEMRRRRLELRKKIGAAPWEDRRFQIVGTVGLHVDFAVAGRDIHVPASAEATLAWWVKELGAGSPSDRRMETAARVIAEFEVNRRQKLAAVASRLVALAAESTPALKEGAYIAQHGDLFCVPFDRIPVLQDFAHRTNSLFADSIRRCKQLLGQ